MYIRRNRLASIRRRAEDELIPGIEGEIVPGVEYIIDREEGIILTYELEHNGKEKYTTYRETTYGEDGSMDRFMAIGYRPFWDESKARANFEERVERERRIRTMMESAGERLSNGAYLLDRQDGVVFAYLDRGDRREYAIWLEVEQPGCDPYYTHGQYYSEGEFDEAISTFDREIRNERHLEELGRSSSLETFAMDEISDRQKMMEIEDFVMPYLDGPMVFEIVYELFGHTLENANKILSYCTHYKNWDELAEDDAM